MQAKSNQLLIFLLILIVAFSGCIGGPVETGNGVIIKDFEADFTDVYSTEVVNFNLRVQNTGSATATEVHAELLGIDEDWNDHSVGNWQSGENLPNENECRYTSEGFSLIPPSPQYRTEGQTHICTWTYKAPELPSTISVTYYPTVRVFYRYSSDVVKSITIVPREEAKALQDQGKTLPTETVSSTNAPITLDIETEGPIRAFEDHVTFPLSIKIRNMGGGVVCLEECKKAKAKPEEQWNRLRITIKSLGSDMILKDCNEQLEVSLYKGQENSITCMIEARNLPLTKTQRLMRIHADYDYFIEKQIPVRVTAKL